VNKYLKISKFIFPLVVLIIGIYLVPINIFNSDFSKILGDKGDARFNNYVLEHGYKYLKGEVSNYWDMSMMYPFKNVTAFSDNLLGTMPLYSFFRFFGNTVETSFQWWIISVLILNFVISFIVFFKISYNILISSAASYIFAFGIYNIGHFDHVQVFPKFIAPLVIYLLWKFLTDKKLIYFFWASIGLVYQFYCGVYLGFFLVYGILFLTIAYFIVYKDKGFLQIFNYKRNIFYFVSTIVFCLILLSFLMLPYYNALEVSESRNFDAIINTIPRPISFFFTHIASENWYILTQHSQFAFPVWWSHFHFVGILPWISIFMSIYLIFKKRHTTDNENKLIRFLLCALFLNLIFCLNINDFSLYRLIHFLPGFNSMRSLDRIINIQIIFFLFVFVVIFNKIKISRNYNFLIYLFITILTIFENKINVGELKTFDKKESQHDINQIVNQIKNQYSKNFKAIAYMPIQNKPKSHDEIIEKNISVILAAQQLNIPVVNSYTGNYPPNYMSFFDNMDESSLQKWCNYVNCDMNTIQKITDTNFKK
jgi:hypothetical protein